MRGWRVWSGLLCLVLGACAEQRVPDALIDVWRTRAPGYEDRFLEVRADSIVFGTGGHGDTSHLLEAVEVEESADGRVHCLLRYQLHGGGSAALRLVLEAGPPETLHFENREEPWQRERDATWLAKREPR